MVFARVNRFSKSVVLTHRSSSFWSLVCPALPGCARLATRLTQSVSIETSPTRPGARSTADAKLAEADYFQGRFLEGGIGGEPDLIEAAKYYKLSADQNYAEAQFAYGLCLEQDKGAARDLVQAAKYYKLAADQGVDKAQFNYGMYLGQGKGVAIDLIQAVKYHKLAPDQDFAPGQLAYAECLAHGKGVALDLVKSTRIYKSRRSKLCSDTIRIWRLSRRGHGRPN
jgi:TPR repeat protein